ncbi:MULTISPECIES: hypothetical protein [unclassified Mesorhizobium]|uniref:hypothetical protein n=1 Tax=unclassified Mesorhizobium TaxID=325217 RepID=UPI0003CF6A09|nr:MULTISPECIES: hypothetical protein [unclassified Mesorhizobium]ESY22356.1 hypothetical protein X751_04740 [Mesorhizobium sp. LNJC395A00]WJI73035.1 hypothetical protein NLY37_18575 [Mesorhizobium sp. C395A]
MIVFVTGDLLAAQESYIAQGVAEGNQEGLGTGLALKISKKWPNVQAAFKKYARTGRFIWSQTAISRASFIWQPSQICITPRFPIYGKQFAGL